MCKEELFNKTLDIVSSVTGISENDILKSRTEECSDARYILVKFLWSRLPCVVIGNLIGRTRQGVRSIMNREKADTWLVNRNWKEVVKQLESIGF